MDNYYYFRSHQHLGSGQFGSVARGVWKRNGREKEVALKTLKTEENMDKIKLLQEAVIMVQFQHPNVLYLYGVAGQEETVRSMIMRMLGYRAIWGVWLWLWARG